MFVDKEHDSKAVGMDVKRIRIFGTDKGYRRLKALKSNEVEVEAGSKQI
ncbi:hypothetical protein CK203_007508 [Vitis vinifera]|uniref:Uncharacterized protein n=1 Tax=Vitis vinifera TaxID=29760 RepID=A0A438G1N2_VITVI|nr:hypothetical protein CK203_075088 [Vitis vinifera]RVW66116.1 hypothetical protein CK203_007508 [Vitis vinifera]